MGITSDSIELPPGQTDPRDMALNGSNNARAVAVAAFRGKHFMGYGVKTSEGWSCVASVGMGWSKHSCRSMEDVRCWLRMSTQATQFDLLASVEELEQVIGALPVYAAPAILPQDIRGVAAKLPKLQAGMWN